MQRSFIPSEVRCRQGAYLPHWTADHATYHTVFRLADSLPAHVVAALCNQREILRQKLRTGQIDENTYQSLHRRHFSERIEEVLDAGHGACWMKDPRIADLVAKALVHFDGVRYKLDAAAIMPNHGHAIVMPLPGYQLPDILKAWKGYTAQLANRILGRSGEFWRREYYDHLIRDESEYRHTVDYVLQNPNKARLRDWPWVWDGSCWGESPRETAS